MSLFNKGFAGAGENMNNDSADYQPTHQINLQLNFAKYLSKDKLCAQKFTALLENRVRPVVRDEVEQTIQRYAHLLSRPSPTHQVEPSKCRPYKLQFQDKLPCILFTENKVVSEGNAPVKIQLFDAFSEQPVIDGPLSSKKIEIVVIQGLSKVEQLEDWTKEEFCKHILSRRDNKKPLLVGHCVIALNDGVGCIDDICITDNSAWVRNKMFRLGARIIGEEDQVIEAMSTPFRVKERRVENLQKHAIPSPEDEVWRLRWIGRKGVIHRRLEEHQIHKVKDLVKQYRDDQSVLRRILNVSRKRWDAIIQQATSCSPANPSEWIEINIPFDEEQIQMPELNHSMDFDDTLLNNLMLEPFNDDHLTSLDYSMP